MISHLTWLLLEREDGIASEKSVANVSRIFLTTGDYREVVAGEGGPPEAEC